MASKSRVGFRAARRRLCEALNTPRTIIHEPRSEQPSKNLLQSGVVTPEEVFEVVRAARGHEYNESPHHQEAEIIVHVIARPHQNVDWYIKWYIIEPNAVFISVHF